MVFTPTVRVQASGIVVASHRMLVPLELDALCDIIMALYIYIRRLELGRGCYMLLAIAVAMDAMYMKESRRAEKAGKDATLLWFSMLCSRRAGNNAATGITQVCTNATEIDTPA